MFVQDICMFGFFPRDLASRICWLPREGWFYQGGAEGFSASLRVFSVLTYLLPWTLAVQIQVPTWLLLFYCLGPVSKQCWAAWGGLCEAATPTGISQTVPACSALAQQQQGYCSRLGASWLLYAASSLPHISHLKGMRAGGEPKASCS